MKAQLQSTVESVLTAGKGILAADESLPTIEKRFKAVGVPSTEATRRAYRQLLFATPGLSDFISGAILFDETIRQWDVSGVRLPDVLAHAGIVPGIKVDQGTVAFRDSPGEKITLGLEGLENRLPEYRELGARFTKWRAVLAIGSNLPSSACLEANARALAEFAAVSQAAGLVPIVEPEVLMDGAHTIEQCEAATARTLAVVFQALTSQGVDLGRTLLKTGMVLSGSHCPRQAIAADIAKATVRCLRESVPDTVPGILFLSGGQSEEAATERLNAICQEPDVPWTLSFSFGRALQSPALKIWRGTAGNVPVAQTALYHRAECNGMAVRGKYSPAMETVGLREPLSR